MCLNHDLYFFWVSSLAYPNLLGKKGYVVVVVVVVVQAITKYRPVKCTKLRKHMHHQIIWAIPVHTRPNISLQTLSSTVEHLL